MNNICNSIFVKVKDFNIDSKSKMEFQKCDMHVILIESMTILLLIIVFEHEFVLIFCHVNSIRKFRIFFSKLDFCNYFYHHCWCKRRTYNSHKGC